MIFIMPCIVQTIISLPGNPGYTNHEIDGIDSRKVNIYDILLLPADRKSLKNWAKFSTWYIHLYSIAMPLRIAHGKHLFAELIVFVNTCEWIQMLRLKRITSSRCSKAPLFKS